MSLAQYISLIMNVPAQLSWSERLFLYSSVLSFAPKCCLEIGAWEGGSTTIISIALDYLGSGELFSIDPRHQITEERYREIAHRTTLIHGHSPKAIQNVGCKFDFAFIDGNHEALTQDCEGIYPFLLPDALLIFHDAYFPPVKQSLDKWVSDHPAEMLDHGIVDRSKNQSKDVDFGGLRVITYHAEKNHATKLFL